MAFTLPLARSELLASQKMALIATIMYNSARIAKVPWAEIMPSRYAFVTSSRFQRRVPAGRHDRLFRLVFGSDAVAARFFSVSRMTVWRWRHDRIPLPSYVTKILPDLIQDKVTEAHLAQTEFGNFLREPPRPPRPLSGCCAGRHRKPKRMPRTPEEWAALG